MPNRFVRTILLGFLFVAVAFTARPYVNWLLFAATEPRPVEARGSAGRVLAVHAWHGRETRSAGDDLFIDVRP